MPPHLPRPCLLYGTAWKEDRTEALVRQAIAAGFRAIDTANQRKHYHEAAVGAAITAAIREGAVERRDLFLQTKFTFLGGQDHRLPYDPSAPTTLQVQHSFASSLEHLGVSHLDSYVLHGPSQRVGLGNMDWEAWHAIEELQASGQVAHIGASNVTLEQLRLLCDRARVVPAFVQNRCYATRGWDRAVREFCRQHDIVYQGFSLLTANRRELASPAILAIAERTGRTAPQIVFRFAIQIGMLPLTGTTDPAHMREDLAIDDFSLSQADLHTIETIGA